MNEISQIAERHGLAGRDAFPGESRGGKLTGLTTSRAKSILESDK